MDAKEALFVFILTIQQCKGTIINWGDNSLYFVTVYNVEEYTFYLYYPLIKTGGLYLKSQLVKNLYCQLVSKLMMGEDGELKSGESSLP